MRLDRKLLKDRVEMQMASPDADRRCIGHNFLIEENVSDERRLELENHDPGSTDVVELFLSCNRKYVQGRMRGHMPSTFKMPTNSPALQPVAVHPSRKLIRLELLDEHLLPKPGGVDFNKLNLAWKGGDPGSIFEILEKFHELPGERPVFSGYMSDVRRLLRKKDWLPCIIDCFGLYHLYSYDPMKLCHFALFEYTAAEVIEQATRKGIRHCFALPTVLEAWNSPAFCPVPNSTGQGRVVSLGETSFSRPPREILHARFDCLPRHLILLGAWRVASKPDIMEARRRHLVLLREDTGRPDFGMFGEAQ